MSTSVTGPLWTEFVSGAATLDELATGRVSVHRLPRWARAQVDDATFAFAESCPAGISVRFENDSETASFTLAATTVATEDAEPEPISLVVRGGETETLIPLAVPSVIFLGPEKQIVDIRQRDAGRVVIPTPGNGPVEVLLPHNARVELVSLESTGTLVPSPTSAPRWTHYGSSISHGMNAVSAARTWPVAAATRLGWNLHNLSFAGNAQLDGFAARIIRDAPADLITLKVGINVVNADSMRERTFRPAVHAFLDTIREGHAVTPIMLISAIACPIHESTPGPVVKTAGGAFRAAARSVDPDTGALTLARTRQILADIVAARADDHLRFLDGRELFGDQDVAMLHDGLHPDQNGIDLIAQRFTDFVANFDTQRGTPLHIAFEDAPRCDA